MISQGSDEMQGRDELRDELLAVTSARRELSPEEDRYLVESFLNRLDQEIEARVDARIEARLAHMPTRRPPIEPWVVPAALALSIPIVAIAGAFAGWVGIVASLIFVIAFFSVYAEYSGKK